jgi:two-component system osmolarity sensor histidine kinase EnvZ
MHTAQQIASLVNLSRAALVHSDAIARVSLIKTMADQEACASCRASPATVGTAFDRTPGTAHDRRAHPPPGPGHHGGQSVNGERGLWVGFNINGDPYWLLMDRSRFSPLGGAPG